MYSEELEHGAKGEGQKQRGITKGNLLGFTIQLTKAYSVISFLIEIKICTNHQIWGQIMDGGDEY